MRFSLKYSIILFFLSLLVPSIAYAQIEKIYLHPKSAGSAKQSNFVDSIRFIPLEVKEGIELLANTNIQVTEKYFLLTDNASKFILLYARNGRFVKKISYRKLGEGFYPSYRADRNELVFFGYNKNYALTTKDHMKIRLDWDNPRNKKYYKKYRIDLDDTTFTLEKQHADENDIVQAFPLYDKYYWQGKINTSPLYKEGQDFELKIYKDKKLVKKFFPYNRVSEPRFLYVEDNASVTKMDKPFIHFVTRPYCDTIYKMIRDSLVPTYHLVMPLENTLPPHFFTTPFKSKTDRENFQRNNGWMFRQVYNFYETPQLLYFSIRYQSNYDSYIYQKQGNTTYKTRSIRADTSHYNLQLLADFNLLRRGDKFYKVQKAGDLIQFFDQHKDAPVPKELQTFLKLNPHSTTPVIVEFKLKTTP